MLWVIRNQVRPRIVRAVSRGLNGTQFAVLPKHFLPPILVNASLGTVLWATYTEVSAGLESTPIGQHPTLVASLSGGVAGAMQAVAAAPVENVRLVVEGGSAKSGWSSAWQEVFRRAKHLGITGQDTEAVGGKPNVQDIKKAREVRDWVRDVRGMAGRGWEGWGWGVAKDSCGKATSFKQ
jgi:hypothetical protein